MSKRWWFLSLLAFVAAAAGTWYWLGLPAWSVELPLDIDARYRQWVAEKGDHVYCVQASSGKVIFRRWIIGNGRELPTVELRFDTVPEKLGHYFESPCGKYVVVNGQVSQANTELWLFEIATGRLIHRESAPGRSEIPAQFLITNEDERLVLSSDEPFPHLHFFTLPDFKLIKTLKLPKLSLIEFGDRPDLREFVFDLQFIRDGQWIVLGIGRKSISRPYRHGMEQKVVIDSESGRLLRRLMWLEYGPYLLGNQRFIIVRSETRGTQKGYRCSIFTTDNVSVPAEERFQASGILESDSLMGLDWWNVRNGYSVFYRIETSEWRYKWLEWAAKLRIPFALNPFQNTAWQFRPENATLENPVTIPLLGIVTHDYRWALEFGDNRITVWSVAQLQRNPLYWSLAVGLIAALAVSFIGRRRRRNLAALQRKPA